MKKKKGPPKLFLSYRRGDLNGHAAVMVGRIYDRLQSHWGQGNIFMDVDAIPPGVNFVDHLNEAVEKADILLAVVGPNWVELMAERANEESDFVRIEMKAALDRSIPVIPLLIGDARMPSAEQLPEELGAFTFRNAVSIDSGRDFNAHMSRLISDVDELYRSDAFSKKEPPQKKHTGFKLVVFMLFVISAWFILFVNPGFLSPTHQASSIAISENVGTKIYQYGGLTHEVTVKINFSGQNVSGEIIANDYQGSATPFQFTGTREGNNLFVEVENNGEFARANLSSQGNDGTFFWQILMVDQKEVLEIHLETRSGSGSWKLELK